MSLTNAENYIREHLWAPIRRSLVSWDNHDLLQRSWSSITTFLETVRNEQQFIYRQQLGNNGKHTEIFVRLPYIGPVQLDVFAFASSAIVFRVYMFWRGRVRRWKTHSSRSITPRNEACRESLPAKAKQVMGFQDTSLQKTMEECQVLKQRLRKVQDPELSRRQRQKELKDINEHRGYLGMSKGTLQKARKSLKQVSGSNQQDSYCSDQESRWPFSARENHM
jgi:hypothetical protein